MATMTFSGRYAGIRKDFYKGIMSEKFVPGKENELYINGKSLSYKTESGFRNAQIRKFNEDMKKIDRIENAGIVVEGTFATTYSKNRQSSATVTYVYSKNGGLYTVNESFGPTGGWGYDKRSTALAAVFNKSPEFVRILMDARAKKKKLPYGVSLEYGKPWLPSWDWGIGVSCYVNVLEACGYDVNWVKYDKKDGLDVYNFRLKNRRGL